MSDFIYTFTALSCPHIRTHSNIKDAFPSSRQGICCRDARRREMMFTGGKHTHWSQLDECVCGLIIFALSPAISSFHFLICPSFLSSLLFILSLFCRLSCRFNILPLPSLPSSRPLRQQRVRKVNFPTASLPVFDSPIPPSNRAGWSNSRSRCDGVSRDGRT